MIYQPIKHVSTPTHDSQLFETQVLMIPSIHNLLEFFHEKAAILLRIHYHIFSFSTILDCKTSFLSETNLHNNCNSQNSQKFVELTLFFEPYICKEEVAEAEPGRQLS